MKIALVSMGETSGKLPVLEHCCYGFEDDIRFHHEIYLFQFALRNRGYDAKHYDGNFNGEEDVLDKLGKERPDRIFYYVYTPYIRKKEEFMKKLSKLGKLSLVITPYYWREKILKEFPFVEDVYYDGEKAIEVDTTNTKIDYEEINIEPFKTGRFFPLIVSKYCPYQCTYCNARKTGYMERNLDIIREELEYLKKNGFKKFLLSGNILTMRRESFFKICKIMEELDLEWSGDGRVDHMKDDEMFEAVKKSRGTMLFGAESASQDVLDKMKKGTTLKQLIETAEKFHKLGIPFRYTFMFGFPWDSYKTFEEMIELRKKVGALNYQVNMVASYPGQPLFEEMKELNLVNESEMDYEDFSWAKLPLAPTLYLTKKEVADLSKKIMIRSAINKNVIKHLLRTRKLRDYPGTVSRGMKLLIHGRRTWRE